VLALVFIIVTAADPAGGFAPADSTVRGTPADSSEVGTRADSSEVGTRADSMPFRLVTRATFALATEARGQVIEPAGLATDAFGRIYVTDAALHRLQRYERDGRWLGESGALGSEAGEMRFPGSVVALGAVGVGVLDRENRRVVAFDLFGRRIGTVLDLAHPAVEGRTGRVDPVGLAADRGGALYVADPARERVLVFDASGVFLRTIGGFGTRAGQFRGLRGLALTPRGELVVAERQNARVQTLDAGGRVVATWRLPVERGVGALPVAVDEHGRTAVADEATGRLWVFDGAGRLLAAATGPGHPRALVFAPDGSLLVVDREPAALRRMILEPARGSAAGGE